MIAWGTVVPAEIRIVEEGMGAVIADSGHRVHYVLALRIEALDRIRTILMAPTAIGILANEMIIFFRMNDKRDLARFRGASGPECGLLHGNIHLHELFNDLACACVCFVEHLGHVFCSAWLVIQWFTVLLSITLCQLIGIQHIHAIGETVVSGLNLWIRITDRFIGGLVPRERGHLTALM